MAETPYTFQWAAPFPSQLSLCMGGSGPPCNTWFVGPARVHNPNSISNGSAVFAIAQFTIVINRPTDSLRYCICNNSSSKVKYTSICIALYHDSSLKRSGMARVNEGSHSFTCHPHVYPQVEWTISAFTPQPQSITALWLVLISRPAEGRRLSWPGWLGEILRWFARRRRSPIPVLTEPDVE